jgi:hypothetical protein
MVDHEIFSRFERELRKWQVEPRAWLSHELRLHFLHFQNQIIVSLLLGLVELLFRSASGALFLSPPGGERDLLGLSP